MPLGISFFAFKQISFVIDTYKREVAKYGFINYVSFVTFFPQLVAESIVTHDELIPQFMDESKNDFHGIISQKIFIYLLLVYLKKYYWLILLVMLLTESF